MRSGFSVLRGAVVPLLVLGFALTACNPTNPGKSARARATAQSGLSDANIAAIVVAANTIDIENGRLAVARTTNPDVKAFAERMVTDHTAVNEQAAALVTRLKITPEASPTSEALLRNAEQTRSALRAQDGPAFDKAYVDNEVAYHQAVLDALDSSLLPNAHNPELKALLASVRPAFVAHLDHAKQIQSALAKQ